MYTFNEFVDTYNVNINFVEFYGIIRAIPNDWKQTIIDENIKLDRICNEIVEEKKTEANLVNISINYLFREILLLINCHKYRNTI
jgi:hypothetical protein